jgi:hypothetical protein
MFKKNVNFFEVSIKRKGVEKRGDTIPVCPHVMI